VLPGAFSAYRFIALQNDKNGKGPLASYFKGEVMSGQNTDMFTANMCTFVLTLRRVMLTSTPPSPDLAEDVSHVSHPRKVHR
jgi:chitin synthase